MSKSSSSAILAQFSKETNPKKSRSNSLNIYTIKRLTEQGREYKVFECRRKKGLTLENPLTRLLNKGTLTKQEHSAGKDYYHNYEIANVSRHARPSYDGTSIGSSSPDREFYTQSQFEASRKLAEARNKIMIYNIGRSEKRVFSRRYAEILDQIFERQIAVRVVEENTGINHAAIERKVKEICAILLK